MSAGIQIFTNQTGTGNSTPFKTDLKDISRDFKPMLAVYGDIGDMQLSLEYKAADDSYYPTGDVIDDIGLYDLPILNFTDLRVSIPEGSSIGLNVFVYNGRAIEE